MSADSEEHPLDPNGIDKLDKEITDALRPSEGIKGLDYALDGMDEGATMALYAIDTNPNTEDIFKKILSWKEGVYHSIRVADVYIRYKRAIKARKAVSEAERCLRIGQKFCRSEIGGTFGEIFAYEMYMYYQYFRDYYKIAGRLGRDPLPPISLN
jgi:hypothetical protein